MPEAKLIQNGTVLQSVTFDAPCRLSDVSPLLPQPCGGKGYCGKCRVHVRGDVSRMTAAEHEKLTKPERTQGIRLACQAMAKGNVTITLPDTGSAVKAGTAAVTAVKPMGSRYGFVLDLGTTTISAALYHLPTGKLCGQKTAANPQIFDGADVLTRLDCAVHGDAKRLSVSVQHALFDLCAALLMEQKIAPNDADAAVLVGNTSMLYLLLGIDPSSLAVAPFRCDTSFGDFYNADFLPVLKGTKLYVPPCISAFLGADTTAAVLGSELHTHEGTILADLGTNAEMVLHTGEKYYGCSCAAGPAFEGVGLSCGMPAVSGAVHTVRLSGGYYSFETVDHVPPKGFCGSGTVDILACMLRDGSLQPDGKLTGSDRFYLADTPLYISQQDIRAVQLAKAAVRTGLEVLRQQTNSAINALSLAGSFGTFLHLPSAVRVGLIPPIFADKSTVCGNAAAVGGAMLLTDSGKIRLAEQIAQATKTIPLADFPEFQDTLYQYMALE